MNQDTTTASSERLMRDALEKIASAHRFNLAAMRPHEVHEVVFNALEAADSAKSSRCEHQVTHSHLRQAVEQAESVEHAVQLGIAAGAEAAYADVAQAIGYPEHWDTATFPTLLSAVAGMVYRPDQRKSA